MSSIKTKSAAEEERQKHRDEQGKYTSYKPGTSAADELCGIGEGQDYDVDAVVADELSSAMVPGNPENMVMRRCGGGYMLMDRADAPRRIIYTDPLGRARVITWPNSGRYDDWDNPVPGRRDGGPAVVVLDESGDVVGTMSTEDNMTCEATGVLRSESGSQPSKVLSRTLDRVQGPGGGPAVLPLDPHRRSFPESSQTSEGGVRVNVTGTGKVIHSMSSESAGSYLAGDSVMPGDQVIVGHPTTSPEGPTIPWTVPSNLSTRITVNGGCEVSGGDVKVNGRTLVSGGRVELASGQAVVTGGDVVLDSGTSGSVVHGGSVTIRSGAAANVLGGRVYVEEGATAYVISDDIEVEGPGRKVVYPVPRSPAVYPAPERDFDSLRKGRLETVW